MSCKEARVHMKYATDGFTGGTVSFLLCIPKMPPPNKKASRFLSRAVPKINKYERRHPDVCFVMYDSMVCY